MDRIDDWLSTESGRVVAGGVRIAVALSGVVALLVLASYCTGCGPSALHAHTEALTVAVDTHATAGGVADAAYQRELDAAQTVAEVDAVEARWQPVAHALDAVRDTLLSYASALRAAVLAEGEGDWQIAAAAAVARAVQAYDQAARAMVAAGVEAPTLPGTVLGAASLVAAMGER